MAVTLRKFLFLVLMLLALLAGTVGWTVRAISTPLSHSHHVSIQTSRQLADGPHTTCPPPPYVC
jgi:hypothetical protein